VRDKDVAIAFFAGLHDGETYRQEIVIQRLCNCSAEVRQQIPVAVDGRQLELDLERLRFALSGPDYGSDAGRLGHIAIVAHSVRRGIGEDADCDVENPRAGGSSVFRRRRDGRLR
jgi:hypothetical protein